jgi:hypothetical protein
MLTLAGFIPAWSFRFERARVLWLMAESQRYCTLRKQHGELRVRASRDEVIEKSLACINKSDMNKTPWSGRF